MNTSLYRSILCFSILFFNSICSFSQSDVSSKTFFFDQKFKLIKNSLLYNDTASFRINKNTPIRIVKTKVDSIFIELSPSEKLDVSNNLLLSEVGKRKEIFYFLISEGTDKLKFTDFDVSPLVIPIKIRPSFDNNPIQFLGDVALGPYFGYQTGTRSIDLSSQVTQTAFTICIFGSPTMINLNPSNTTEESVKTSSVLGISAGSGLLFDVNNLQFGLVGGWDWISGTDSQTWKYQGKPWLSFSFAYNLINQ